MFVHAETEISEAKKSDAIEWAKQALRDNISYGGIGMFIKNKFNKKYGKEWNCIVGMISNFDQSALAYQPGHYICYRLERLQIVLFKSKVSKMPTTPILGEG